jgi:hypothetical protein
MEIARILWPPLHGWGLFPHPPLIIDGRTMLVRQAGE